MIPIPIFKKNLCRRIVCIWHAKNAAVVKNDVETTMKKTKLQ